MESGRGSGGGLRSGPGGKKMRKRKELDALVGGVGGGKRNNGGNKRAGSGGVSPQDQLLSESTGEEEYWSSKGGKGRQRYISNGASRGNKSCTAVLRVCTILLVMACLVATLTVMWLFIDIREQTSYLHSQLDQVAAGSQGVPDALQKCHSLSRQLQNNQTLLFSRMALLSQNLDNFTAQMNKVQSRLSNVEGKLTASPELVNVPHDLQALSDSVASFGSQIQDLRSTSTSSKEEHTRIFQLLENLKDNITGLNKVVHRFDLLQMNLSARVSDPVENAAKELESFLNGFQSNLTNINKTLNWVHEDQHRDRKLLEDLQESSANVSSILSTLQNECSNQILKYDTLTAQVLGYKVDFEDVYKQIATLKEQYQMLKDFSSQLGTDLSNLKLSINNGGVFDQPSFNNSKSNE